MCRQPNIIGRKWTSTSSEKLLANARWYCSRIVGGRADILLYTCFSNRYPLCRLRAFTFNVKFVQPAEHVTSIAAKDNIASPHTIPTIEWASCRYVWTLFATFSSTVRRTRRWKYSRDSWRSSTVLRSFHFFCETTCNPDENAMYPELCANSRVRSRFLFLHIRQIISNGSCRFPLVYQRWSGQEWRGF